VSNNLRLDKGINNFENKIFKKCNDLFYWHKNYLVVINISTHAMLYLITTFETCSMNVTNADISRYTMPALAVKILRDFYFKLCELIQTIFVRK